MPSGNDGSSWLMTVSGSVAATSASTGATSVHVGQSRFTTATRPSCGISGVRSATAGPYPSGRARAPRSALGEEVDDQAVHVVGALELEEVAGALDDRDARPWSEERLGALGRLDADA